MILVHICCSVDSHFFLQKLQNDFKNEKLIGFFYDPNIHPYSEYQLRLLDVKRSCDLLGIELIDGEYDIDAWIDITKDNKNDPEKGERCGICFDFRFENSAKKAKQLNIKKMTSTLLTSPKKSIKQLQTSGESIANKYGIEFITVDYRKNGGTQEQSKIAKEQMLYKQNYCGCLYALKEQRKTQNKFLYELMSPITKQILPASIEEKLEIYTKRIQLEDKNIKYKIIKDSFINYRLLFGKLKINKQAVDSYILYFSKLKQQNANYKIEHCINNIHYLNRNNIRILDIKEINKRLSKDYSCVKDMIKKPPLVDEEIKLRLSIDKTYSTNPIVVVDNIEDKKYNLSIKSEIFDDIRDILI